MPELRHKCTDGFSTIIWFLMYDNQQNIVLKLASPFSNEKTKKRFRHLLISKVASFMISHVAFGPEALSTPLWALEGPLISMNPHMDSEILLLTECFTATRVFTLVGLSPIV